ncbi:MAG: cytochrome c family protein [Deltaproteobacteria bacterium]|nr:cytochrome c family protein [Deltaproteobacteria bacterium]
MPKRYLPLIVVLGIAALASVVGLALAPAEPELPNHILMPNAGGRVAFNHAQHAEDYAVACETCHHENAEARVDPKSCGSCHGVAFDKEFAAAHQDTFKDDPQACLTCHHTEFTGTSWDRDMHDMHAENMVGPEGCQTCHHDESIEPEPMACSSCHETIEKGQPVPPADSTPPLYRDAVHSVCADCHAHSDSFAPGVEGLQGCADCHEATEARAEFLESGKTELTPEEIAALSSCAACHYDPAVDEVMRGRLDAFHGQCGSCHAQVGKGPSTEEIKPSSPGEIVKQQCNQCHIR